jgi:predicted enzyme related to lactoylglutathione lyase
LKIRVPAADWSDINILNQEQAMGVTGIGGLFFRARDPKALKAWYKENLGIGAGCNADGSTTADDWYWRVAAGPTVFEPFKETTDYFAADKQFMINLRVSGIDELLAKLRANNIPIETRAEWDSPETGRFARIHDPEGTALELWEPPAD